MDNEAARVMGRWDTLKGDRATFESTWQEIAEYVRPLRAEFTAKRSVGEKRYHKIYDSTPLMAADNFAGGIFGMMTNPANRWMALKLPGDEELEKFGPVKDWLYTTTTAILNSFGPEVSRFYNVVPSFYADLACFGTAVFYSEEIDATGRINDSVRALAEVCIGENAFGEVDTVYRRFEMGARAAVQFFGEENVSDDLKRIAQDKPFERAWFIHCVEENGDYDESRLARDNKPWRSIYIEERTRKTIRSSGYMESPYQVARWSQAAGEIYGRGLGELVLADVKTLHQQSRTSLVAAQKVADPPLLAPDEGVIAQARTWAGGITYGAIDMDGRQLLRPLVTGADVGLTLQMMDQRRQSIKDGFYFSLMQMVGAPDMTATEWLGRQEEKLRLMGPNLGRIQSEFLSPLVARRFNMLLRMGKIPEPPPELSEQPLRVDYVSPLARAQMATEAQSVVRMYQSLETVMQVDPQILDNIDHDKAVEFLAQGWAVPAPILRGAEARDEIRAQRQQQQQMMMAMQMAQQGANAAKNVGQASEAASKGQNQRAQAAEKGAGGQGGNADLGSAIQMLRQALRGQPAA